ncbi:LysE family translocator [Prevotella sp. kh1p2]|uniref:LysE family translocator n=1 Tax=Prevotella sp. kh1p2 TaxID=1761883 RepID=UPI0008CF50A5|nr:LysE family transporter [Prevotella sp. kh1p2]SET10591.1 Threonine/homoserine/homoserine lactone efflux protein [Prevotella sp. kh1p2]SNU11850.1 Threonine/homoserine/homoserine lactone efflux protein [Prevotellaceae bacterium KH2P17]
MPFPIHIDILDIIFKGLLIGIISSAPMGPVGVLCVQRTLNKGRWYGFVTGVGAAASDIIYALITGLGMSFVMDLITNPTNFFWLKISGSVILLLFGVYCFRSDPTKNMHISGKKKGSLWHNGITAFLVTFSNPLIIFLFMAAFAQLGFVIPNRPVEMGFGFLGIIIGALVWWFGLTWLIDKVRGKFDNFGIQIINKVIGSVVILISLIILVGTIFNLYTFHY